MRLPSLNSWRWLLIWLIILFLFLIHTLLKGTFGYSRLSRRDMLLIPTYTLLMVIISVDRHLTGRKLLFLIILFVIGALIGRYQASGVVIRTAGQTRHGHPLIKAKRNWPYLIGWIFIFVIDVTIQVYFGLHMNADEVANEFIDYLLKNLNPIFMVFFHTDWYIWTLTFASYFGYYRGLVRHFPEVRQIVRRNRPKKWRR